MNSEAIKSKINDINLKRKSSEDICLNDDGKRTCDHGIVANKFHDYFINISKNLLKDLGEKNNQHNDYFKNPNKHS